MSIAMYPAICWCDDQAFDDISKECEKKEFIVKKSLWSVPSKGIVEQAKKKNGGLRLLRADRELTKMTCHHLS